MTASRSQPLPGDWPVERALDAYLAENGFTREGYDARRTPAHLFGIRASACRTPRDTGLYVGTIIVVGVLLGLLVAPRRTARAFRRAGGGRNLFHRDAPAYEDQLAMSVGELRALLALPDGGLSDRPRGLHGGVPQS